MVLPGIYETGHFMRPLIAAMHERGHSVHVIETLRRNGRPVIEGARGVVTYLDELEALAA